MKITAISDTHGFHEVLPLTKGDVLIHAGDATLSGVTSELETFAKWFDAQPFKHKIFVPGNHELCMEYDFAGHAALFKNSIVLHDQSVEIEGVKFYGSSWQPEFHNWAFNVPRGPQAVENWSKIPDDTEVLITHGPPFGTMDMVHTEGLALINVGCEALDERVNQLKNLKLHVFGHIHEHHGYITKKNVTYVNAAILDERYTPTRGPINIVYG